MFTSPDLSSKPSVPWSLFSPVGMWLLDGAKYCLRVLAMGGAEMDKRGFQVGFFWVGRRDVSQFAQFSEDSDRSWMVDQNRSCTALHRINERERERAIVSPLKLAVIKQ